MTDHDEQKDFDRNERAIGQAPENHMVSPEELANRSAELLASDRHLFVRAWCEERWKSESTLTEADLQVIRADPRWQSPVDTSR